MIYTLYSYKGGVGRSMALANLAECFFEKGLRVIMIDWDLEAPGLEAYFYPHAEDNSATNKLAQVSARPGLINMLQEYQEKFPELARPRSSAMAPEALAPGDREKRSYEIDESARITKEFLKGLTSIPEHLRPVRFASGVQAETSAPVSFSDLIERSMTPLEQYLQLIHESGTAKLWLLTAGARAAENFAEYASSVQDFDWLEFLAASNGKEYLEWFRNKLASIADVVLIDSRTGVTEMGGVCTRQMADAVVSFCAPNFQNLDGVARVAGALETAAAKKARYDRDLHVMVIPTRIDDFESGLLQQFSNDFSSKMEVQAFIPEPLRDLDRPMWNLQVPYIPQYNYREQRVIGPGAALPDPPTQKLIQAYRKIAVHLAALSPEGGAIRSAFASEIATSFPHLLPHGPPRMAPAVVGNWVERPADLNRLKQALLEGSGALNGGRIAVCGQAGMGKTSLVARTCQDEEVMRAFPDGIIWLTLDRAWDKGSVHDWLRTAFALPRKGGETALALALENRRFLFVVDDVWTLDQLEPIFQFGRQDTRLIITRDLATASAFANIVVSVGTLSEEESTALLKTKPSQVAGGDDPVLAQMLVWPLGASLLRAALERRFAHKETPEKAWEGIRASLQRQGITVFDQPDVADKNSSVARSLRGTIGRLQPEERALLVTVAKMGDQGLPDRSRQEADSRPAGGASSWSAANEPVSAETRRRHRLIDLGLTQETEGVARIDSRVRAWLLSQGELGADGQAGKLVDREQKLKDGYNILRGATAPVDRIWELAKFAKDARSFSLARRLFGLARLCPDATQLAAAKKLELMQQQALCTYKDDDLPAEERFTRAFEILGEGDLHSTTPSQETLGLAGAIHKYRWKMSGQRRDLDHSLGYYRRGAQGELAGDFGYTRINAAFVLDLLAWQDDKDSPLTAQERRAEATKLREEIVGALPGLASQTAYRWLKDRWWYGATLAEACFGLSRHSEAQFWLREALAVDPPKWQLEGTTRQLAGLAQAQGVDKQANSPAWQTLRILVGEADPALRAMIAGKLGVALSGGGFRASLFHIGVLARLAELDLLRHVEVLSCVSGGSIIGAHYYLEARRLLQSKTDREITREDYIDIVKRIERDFLAGVQKDLRTRLLGGWLANVRSIFDRGYTRTKYLGELLERHLYARVEDGQQGHRWLNELKILPRGDGDDFNPKLDNWRRGAKAPILLLNATTLNTGHNWQFAVNWMGEPPAGSGSLIDRNDLLRRMYYSEAPLRYQRIRLGQAVAASACVPALFDPLDLDGLYPERSVQLVDGGVHDNQGVGGLLEQECTIVFVSDASGQMNSERTPSTEAYSVPMRSNSILMARVREAEFRELQALLRSSALGGLMFLHLKKDLELNHVDWIDCRDQYEAFDEPGRLRRGTPLTSYRMPKTIQERLAGIRTDLDSFSDSEAYTLMLSGYRMTDAELARYLPDFPAKDSSRETWRFRAIEPAVDRAQDHVPEHEWLLQILKTGASRGFKVWHLVWGFAPAVLLALFALVAAGGAAILRETWWFLQSEVPRLFFPSLATAGSILALCVAAAILHRLLRARKSLTTIFSGLLMATFGWIAAWIHILVFDPIYLAFGTIAKLEDGVIVGGLERGRRRSWLGIAVLTLAGILAFGGTALFRARNSPVRPADRAQALGQMDAAVALWNEALRYDPDNQHALTRRGQALLALHRPSDAVEDLIKVSPRSPEVLRDLAYAYKEQADYGKAIDIYKMLVAENPKDVQAFRDLAYAYTKQKDYRRAIDIYGILLTDNPQDVQAHRDRGFAFQVTGKYELALNDYTSALKIDPDAQTAWACVYMRTIMLWEQRKSYTGDVELASLLERAGFESLIAGDYLNARRGFQFCEKWYPGYHNVEDILQLIRSPKSDFANPAKKKQFLQLIVRKYSWGLPPDLLERLKAAAQ